MRFYTNKKGETIEVDNDHLDTAVRIKQELQRTSPSMKCSWSLHKKMMINEGFDNSDTCESYRQLVKNYQRSIGELPPAPKYAEMVSAGQLESLKQEIGELAWQKREVQTEARRLGKIRRDLIDEGMFVSEVTMAIKNVFSQVKFDEILNHTFSPIPDHNGTRIVALISDWHIGADVDVEGNRYNFEIAQQRINEYTEKLIAIATEKKVYRIDVVFCGDMVEGSYMREGQSYGIEFPVSEQMARGGQLLIELLTKLSARFFTVYRGFAGNHDRMNQKDKNGNIYGDTAMVVVNKIVKVFVEASKIQNLMYVDTHPYHAKLLDVNGRNIKLVHGDHEKVADKRKLGKHSVNDGIVYDVIAYGHVHFFCVVEVGLDKIDLIVGSTKGSDDYSETLGLGSAPSQAVLIISEDGDMEAKRIRLH
jgi:predicted phosphodiesterase